MEFSNHHLILIIPKDTKLGDTLRQFKFKSAWMLEDSYYDIILKVWRSDNDLEENIKVVKEHIKEWKFKSFE